MASILQLQLNQRRQGPLVVPDKSLPAKASLLFDQAKAEHLDLETILNIGTNGLMELRKYDERFAAFEDTLFNPASVSLARPQMSKEAIQKLDKSVEQFLMLLSPYFLLKPAHKAIEWLLRRYQINVHNVTSVIKCILPYHETALFVRVVRLCKLNEEWLFLHNVKKTKTKMDRATLVQNCLKDTHLLNFICELVSKAAPQQEAKSQQVSEVHLTLYVATVLEAIARTAKVTDDFLHVLLPHILTGLKAQNHRNFQMATYMIVAQLSTRTVLAPKLLSTLVKAIAKYATEGTQLDALTALVYLAQTQTIESLDSALQPLLAFRSLPLLLADLSLKFDTSNFLRLFLTGLLSHCTASDDAHLEVFKQVLQYVALENFVPEMITMLLDTYVSSCRDSNLTSEETGNSIKRYLHLIDARYPSQLDTGLNTALQSLRAASNSEGKRSRRKRRNSASKRAENGDAMDETANDKPVEEQVLDFISLTFRGTSHQMLEECSTTLFLALQHPEQQIRLLAVKKVVAQLVNGNVDDEQFDEFIKDALLERLVDDSPQVVWHVFKIYDILLDKIEPEALFKQLSNIITSQNFRADLKTKALETLTGSFLKKNPSYMRVVQSLLFDSLLAQGRKDNLRFFADAINIAAKLASEHKGTIFAGISAAAESVDAPAPSKDKDDATTEAKESPESKRKWVDGAIKGNVLVINALAKNVHSNPATFCPLLTSFVDNDQGKLLTLLVLNKALALDRKDGQGKKRNPIRETLFKVLQDHCSLSDLLSGNGITYQEASKFTQDLSATLESGVPSRELFEHFLLAVRPYFYPVGKPEEEKRQAEHALYLFCLHNITDSFAPKPTDNEFSLIRELFILFISSPSFDLFAPHIKVLASRISAVTSLPLFLSSFLADREDKVLFEDHPLLVQTRCIKLLNTYLMAFLPASTGKDNAADAGTGQMDVEADKNKNKKKNKKAAIGAEHMKALKDREPELHETLVRFFVGLENDDKEIRVSSFFALSTLTTLFSCLSATSATSKLLAKFLHTIATRKADFIHDKTFLRKLFGRLLSEETAAASAEEKKDVHHILADSFTAEEKASLRAFVFGFVLPREKTPKYLRLFLLHLLRDVAAPELVAISHDIVHDSMTKLAKGQALSYFDANLLQVVLTSTLKPTTVATFNRYEGAKESKGELREGTKYLAAFLEALKSPASITFSDSDQITQRTEFLVDYVSPRLCILKSLVETNGFHFMAGLSLANKKVLFMQFIEILLESSYIPVSPSAEAAQADEGKKLKDIDINVVDTSKTIIKSIIRAMNLSSDLILRCLQEQITIARNRTKSSQRKETKTAGADNASAVGKKSKSRRTADEDEDGEEEEEAEQASAKRARVCTTKEQEQEAENEKVAAAKSAEERKKELLVMQRLNLILEIILSQVPFVQDKPVLLQPLATLLDILVQGQKREASPEEEDNEYTKQLILSCLESITQHIYVDLHPKAQQDAMDTEERTAATTKKAQTIEKQYKGAPETIVQCIRVTSNTRTQNKALLALGAVATLYPDLVLRHVMPVFTFMGASTIRHDDNYTFTVMQKSLRAILPSMVKQGGIGVSDVLRIFVDNFQHVPLHRRLHLFASVLQTLSLKYLPDLLLLFLVKHITQGPQEQTQKKLDQSVSIDESDLVDLEEETTIPGFCHSLCEKVPVADLCSAFVPLVEIITDNLEEKTSDIAKYYDKSKMTRAQNIELERTVIDFMLDHFASKPFLNSLLNLNPTLIRSMQPIYFSLFKRTLAYAQQCANHANELKGKKGKKVKAQVELWTNQTQGSYEVIRMLNSFMSTPMFIETVSDLLVHPDSQMRQRALELFNEKVEEQKSLQEKKKAGDEGLANSTKLFLDMVPKLTNIIKDKDMAEDMSLTKQTALLSLEMLSRTFAATYPTHFLGATFDVVSAAMRHANPSVQGSALICQAAICLQLGAKMVPKIPKFMPQVVVLLKKIFAPAKTDEATEEALVKDDANLKLLQVSALSALEVTIDGIGQFLSPYLRDIIQTVVPIPDHYSTPQIVAKVGSVLSVLATKVEARLVLPPIYLSSQFFKQAAPSTLSRFASWVGSVLSGMARDTVQTHHDRLFKFFLDFFDYRRLSHVHEKTKKDVKLEKEVASVEDSFIDAFLHMVMKLSELTFKPLFLRVTHWTTDVVDAKAGEAQSSTFPRLFFFWRLANALADKLKSIFVPYYGYLLDDAVAYLTGTKDVFGEKEESDDEESDEDAVQIIKSSAKKATTSEKAVVKAVVPEKLRVEQKNEFLSLILASLHKCFLYDAENFITPEKFDRLVPALVAQIENNTGSVKDYQARVTEHLIPAISQLAINVGDDKLWKTLNHQVLLTTRSSAAPVRFAGLKVVEAFYQRLGEEFLPLLPETVPFLAELMEDSAMEVEQLSQEVIALINKYLPEGESIASYFQ